MQIKQGKSQKIAASENLKSNLNFRHEKFSRILKYSDTRWAAMNRGRPGACLTPAKWLSPNSCRSRSTLVIVAVQSDRLFLRDMEALTAWVSWVIQSRFWHRARPRSILVRLLTHDAASRWHCGRADETCDGAGSSVSSTDTQFPPTKLSVLHSSFGSSSLLAMTIDSRKSNRSLWTKEKREIEL